VSPLGGCITLQPAGSDLRSLPSTAEVLNFLSCGRVRLYVFLSETTVPIQKRCWSAGTKKNKVSFKALVGDERSSLNGGKGGALGLRESKSNFDKRVSYERGIDGTQDLFKANPPKRRQVPEARRGLPYLRLG
jgi:hypothetical protein